MERRHFIASPAADANRRRSAPFQQECRDGSVFVFDLFEYAEADHAGAQGARKLIGVMKKDAKRFAATGGWGFEGFKGDSQTERLVTDGGAGCFACHASHKKRDYVFSAMRP